MDVFLLILQVIVVLGVLIFFHEFGHFLASLAVGIPVDEFGFGFPPRLFKIGEWKGTEITINLIPFGAFVRPHGEEDDDVQGGMASAPAWKRFVIALAGPAMNFLIGIILLIVLYVGLGVPASDQALINDVAANSPAMAAGLQIGDIITAINDEPVETISDVSTATLENAGTEMTITVDRDGTALTFALIPRVNPPEGEGSMGVGLTNPLKPAPFLDATGAAFTSTGYVIKETLLLPGRLITGAVDAATARPIGYKGIYDVYSQAVTMDEESPMTTAQPLPIYTLSFIANISLALGITNLLPIPALDGGRILFTLPELIFKKRIPQEWENKVNTASFFLLLLLMVFITILDFTNPVVLP
ncbi:MAG: site-2 protease family protein [Anaerolineaceae bacterium]|nr:site-2 protease family protein [Anaerolineaceae bacterium]